MKVLVFLHGTSIMHRSATGRSREERVQQVIQREMSVRDFTSYVPIGNVVSKLHAWSQQGAEIIYLSPHKQAEHIEQDRIVLHTYDFPEGQIAYRTTGQTYQDVVASTLPDIFIEDDCESIGGIQEMTYPHLRPDLQARITSIVVKEFEGIDHLPDNLSTLKILRK